LFASFHPNFRRLSPNFSSLASLKFDIYKFIVHFYNNGARGQIYSYLQQWQWLRLVCLCFRFFTVKYESLLGYYNSLDVLEIKKNTLLLPWLSGARYKLHKDFFHRKRKRFCLQGFGAHLYVL
jgi:hypothetical protein